MAYAKQSYRRSTRRSTRGRATRYRKKAVAVPKPKRTVRKYTRSNAMAINRLARKVSWLTEARYGSVQRNFQVSNLMTPFASQPILTDIMDFTCRRATSTGANFAQYNASGTAVQTVGNWTPSQNIFHSGQNSDIVDTGKYLALSCHVTMRFQATPSAIDTRIRVDLFSVKSKAIQQVLSGQPLFSFPTALSQLKDLANPERNKLGGNPYLRVYATKWLYLSSSRNGPATPGGGQQNPGPAVTGNSGYLSFNICPKKGKLRNQEETVPATPQDISTIIDGDFGPFNVPQDEPLFLLISSSDPSATGTPANIVSVQCSRTVRWRDPIGKASL